MIIFLAFFWKTPLKDIFDDFVSSSGCKHTRCLRRVWENSILSFIQTINQDVNVTQVIYYSDEFLLSISIGIPFVKKLFNKESKGGHFAAKIYIYEKEFSAIPTFTFLLIFFKPVRKRIIDKR